MTVDYSLMTKDELLRLLQLGTLTKTENKTVVQTLNNFHSLEGSIVSVKFDPHPFVVRKYDPITDICDLTILFGDKTPSQTWKHKFYWIDGRGRKRLSFIKGGKPATFVKKANLNYISGVQIVTPSDKTAYNHKII